MYLGAVGILECLGSLTRTELSDTMLKSAAVCLIGTHESGAGLSAVGILGDVGAVRVALDAGIRAARQKDLFQGSVFLPRPADELQPLLEQFFPGYLQKKLAIESFSGRPLFGSTISGQATSYSLEETPTPGSIEQLHSLNVPQLRGLARNLPGLAIRGRAISKANRDQLLSALIQKLFQQKDDS